MEQTQEVVKDEVATSTNEAPQVEVIIPASRVMHIAEDGMCESCQ